jgi:ElaB/YqjD/DUF883 family membrane-anchored ribosome-binding protein
MSPTGNVKESIMANTGMQGTTGGQPQNANRGQANQGNSGQQNRGNTAQGTLQAVQGAVSDAAGQARDYVQQTASAVADRAEHAWDSARRNVGQGADMVSEGYETIESSIRRNPVAAVAIAFGVGMMLGCLSGVGGSSRRY